MNGFLPKDYKIPEGSSRYMKLEDGKNRLRILGSFEDGSAIMGTEYWKTKEDGKRTPIRLKPGVPVQADELELNSYGEPEMPKHFWILPVWNYQAKQVQLLEITQKSIMGAIKNLAQDEEWGSPQEYDLTITRTGEKLKTEYAVVPSPRKDIDAAAVAEYKTLNINIKALYDSGDPFAQTNVQLDDEFLTELNEAVS